MISADAHAGEVDRLGSHTVSAQREGKPWDAALTRAMDACVASFLLVLLSPLLAAIGWAIRRESGRPVIFRQVRVGRGQQRFTVFKFRTMHPGADSSRHRDYVQALIEQGPRTEPGGDGLYKLVIDDRMTRVGRFLRRWSLDELPQLWNVVTGQMSLVGPRPVIEYEVDLYPEWYMARFAVKPGLTGLWQVSGRNQRTYEEMVRYDIQYARERSLVLDLRILVRTLLVVLTRKGAA